MKRLTLLSLLLTLAIMASAIPAKKGVRRMITLQDGTTIQATLQGDEFGSWWKVDDGRTFQLNPQTQTFEAVDINQIKLKANLQRAEANKRRLARAKAASPKKVGTRTIDLKGSKKGLIILVQFQDVKFNKFRGRTFFDNLANHLTDNQRNLGFTGSVSDYFKAQSNGVFELDFDVVGPYTLKYKEAYYGAHTSSGGHDSRPGTMVYEALLQADADVNFADYDWDGDGEVEQVYVLYAGEGEAAGGGDNTIWPHEYSLSNSEVGGSVKLDNVVLDTYACGCELTRRQRGSAYVTQPDGIGTICHEFSHCLGLPDMYDTKGGNYGTGEWDVMCSGSYNGESFMPANYTAYERWFAGWLDPIELKEATTVKGLKSSTDYGKTFVIYNDEHKDEYYLIENRQQNGSFDAGLPGAGLMITHVDYNENNWKWNNLNANTDSFYTKTYGERYSYLDNDHERMAIVHADNNNRSDKIYPDNGNNELTDTSSPAATLYNGTKKLLGKPITNIKQNDDGTIDFDFMGGSTSNVISAIAGIEVLPEKQDGRVYSIDGRYMGKDLSTLPGGIYIRNGKKILK